MSSIDSRDEAMTAVSAAAERHAADYDRLRAALQDLQRELERVRAAALPAIRTAARAAAESRDALAAEIEAHGQLWQGKRRTLVIHGFRIGVRKGKGSIVWDASDAVVRRIRQQFPDLAETLIRVREEPIRSALLELSAGELKRLGCRVEGTGDELVISPVGDNVDKLVEALLAESEHTGAEQ